MWGYRGGDYNDNRLLECYKVNSTIRKRQMPLKRWYSVCSHHIPDDRNHYLKIKPNFGLI
jgi:hypothetical protein